MPKRVQLENGHILEFDNLPSPEDIDHAISQLSGGAGGGFEDSRAKRIIPQFTAGLYSGVESLPFGKSISKILPISEQTRIDLRTTPAPQGVLPNIARGVGEAVPSTAVIAPLTAGAGFIPGIVSNTGRLAAGTAIYGGVKALSEGGTPAQVAGSAATSAGTGILASGLGKVGATVVPEAMPFAKTIGSSAGGYATGKITDLLTGQKGEKNPLTYAALGGIFPSEPWKVSPRKAIATELMKNYVGAKGEYGDRMVQSVAREGIVARDVNSYKNKIENRTAELMKSLTNSYDKATKSGTLVQLPKDNLLAPLSNLQQALTEYPDINQSSINKVGDIINNISTKFDNLQAMTPSEVYGFKKSLGKNINWKNMPTDLPIQAKSNIISKMQDVYKVIDTSLDNAVPNTKEYNYRISNLIRFKDMLQAKLDRSPGLIKRLKAVDITRPVTLISPTLESTGVVTASSKLMPGQYKQSLGIQDIIPQKQ